ncbi:MAG: hypothetical protein Q8M03_06805, partial [Legionella sp.]|nr:hypothetical protein [Legionella sp.]
LSTQIGAALPRACIVGDPSRGDAFLPDDPPKVIVRPIEFDERSLSKKYHIKTYSDTDASGQSRAEQCFRYEVQNLDNDKLRSFSWPLAGIEVDPLGPNERRSRRRFQDVLDNPIDINSRVNALNNSEAITRAYADRASGDKRSSNEQSMPQFAVAALANIDQRLGGLVSQNILSANPIGFYSFQKDGEQTRPIVDSYTGDGFRLDVVSVAEQRSGKIRFRTSVVAQGATFREAQFVMPALNSVAALKDESDLMSLTKAFFSRYQSFKSISTPNKGEWSFISEFSAKDLHVAYRMRAPVLFYYGDTRECVMITSFAPVPFDFQIAECKTLGKK